MTNGREHLELSPREAGRMEEDGGGSQGYYSEEAQREGTAQSKDYSASAVKTAKSMMKLVRSISGQLRGRVARLTPLSPSLFFSPSSSLPAD